MYGKVPLLDLITNLQYDGRIIKPASEALMIFLLASSRIAALQDACRLQGACQPHSPRSNRLSDLSRHRSKPVLEMRDDDAANTILRNSSMLGGLRNRLQALGQTSSIEISPVDSQVREHMFEVFGNTSLLLQNRPLVFIHMVKLEMDHFREVARASQTLQNLGLTPVPHIPASRFATVAEFEMTLTTFTKLGVNHVFFMGGNNLANQVGSGMCAFPHGSKSILLKEISLLRKAGVKTVALAGHPEGYPANGGDADSALALLVEKANLVLHAGMKVAVVTQFCFDANTLVLWLKRARMKLSNLPLARQHCGSPHISFHVGIPGPTPRRKLREISEKCGVSCTVLSSHSVESSTFHPDTLVLALARYCEVEHVPLGEVDLHFFTFGNVIDTIALVSALRDGTWPVSVIKSDKIPVS